MDSSFGFFCSAIEKYHTLTRPRLSHRLASTISKKKTKSRKKSRSLWPWYFTVLHYKGNFLTHVRSRRGRKNAETLENNDFNLNYEQWRELLASTFCRLNWNAQSLALEYAVQHIAIERVFFSFFFLFFVCKHIFWVVKYHFT